MYYFTPSSNIFNHLSSKIEHYIKQQIQVVNSSLTGARSAVVLIVTHYWASACWTLYSWNLLNNPQKLRFKEGEITFLRTHSKPDRQEDQNLCSVLYPQEETAAWSHFVWGTGTLVPRERCAGTNFTVFTQKLSHHENILYYVYCAVFRVRELCCTFQKYQNLDTWVNPGFVQELWPWASCLTILALLPSSGRWELLFEPIISEICGVPCSKDQLLSLRRPWLRTPSPAVQAWEHHLVI